MIQQVNPTQRLICSDLGLTCLPINSRVEAMLELRQLGADSFLCTVHRY